MAKNILLTNCSLNKKTTLLKIRIEKNIDNYEYSAARNIREACFDYYWEGKISGKELEGKVEREKLNILG